MSTSRSAVVLPIVALVFLSQAGADPRYGQVGHGPFGARVMCETITLNPLGGEETLVFRARSDVIVQEIWLDNTPTYREELCNVEVDADGGPVTCKQSDFRIVKLTIMGSDFRPGNLPKCVAKNDSLAIRTMLDQDFDTATAWPLDAGQAIKLTMDAEGCGDNVPDNARRIRVCVGFFGGYDARLYMED